MKTALAALAWVVLLAPARSADAQGVPPKAAEKDVLLSCDFEDDTWKEKWDARGNFTIVEGEKSLGGKGRCLRVEIPANSTGGGSLIYKFRKRIGREPEEMYFRYYVKLDPSWANAIDGGKMPGFSGTYGRAGWGGRAVDGKNGWSARGGFKRPGKDDVALSYYCYHADMRGAYGNHWYFEPALKYDVWYCVDLHCKLNTVGKPGEKGQNDGILRSWINGQPAFEKKDIRFRDVDSLKIEDVWCNFYHGGTRPTPKAMHLYLDDMVIATKYVGPKTEK